MVAAQPIATLSGSGARRFQFRGNAGEFFRIWIVNLCLSVVTLGLYAPWAKVRALRYFAGNLVVSGSHFDYDADPKRILVGRLIVGAAVGLYSLANWLYAPLGAAMAVAGFLLFPAAVVRSTAFHHRHTLFRGIRFHFHASYAEAFKVLVLGPLFGVLTLGVALPWWYARRQAFVVENSRYGTSQLEFDGRTQPYYGVFARAVGVWLAGAAVVAAVFLLIGRTPSEDPIIETAKMVGVALPMMFAGAFAYGVYQAGFTNLMYRNARIADLRFRSELQAAPLAWIYISGAVAVVLSLGLLTPWAQVRLARYRASALTLIAASGLDAFVQGSEPAEGAGALASEAADLFDFDLGL
jgi:uncharacterized membrane protein YjgN (DUF898 family)